MRYCVSHDVTSHWHKNSWRAGCLDSGVPLATTRPCPVSLMSPPVTISLKSPCHTEWAENNNISNEMKRHALSRVFCATAERHTSLTKLLPCRNTPKIILTPLCVALRAVARKWLKFIWRSRNRRLIFQHRRHCQLWRLNFGSKCIQWKCYPFGTVYRPLFRSYETDTQGGQ